VVVTGARQVGKTTLARRFLPDASYVTLDLPSEAEFARLNPAEFFRRHACPLILDEVQYVPELLQHIKRLVDEDRTPGRFLLTSSQNFPRMEGVAESLAGRCAVLTLLPLSPVELSDAGDLAGQDAFLWRGGYPELWQKPGLDRALWLGSYVATCLERDVRNLVNVGSLRDFDRFLRAAALRAGQILSLAGLARDVGVSPNTAKSWISVLEASQQVFLLEPYHRQRAKRLVKSPKLYFVDTGLLAFLLGFTQAADLPAHALWGAVWENFVVAETRKMFMCHGRRPPLWFWRTSGGDEIDLLVEVGPERFVAIECKTAAQADGRALGALRVLTHEYGDACLAKAFVVCRTEQAYPVLPGGAGEAVPLTGAGGLLNRAEMRFRVAS
jgi:hypothetical protein